MRNPLARLARRHPTKPTLRERLAATKAKARQVMAVNRVLLKPPSRAARAVDRIALVNYATWLDFERSNVCAELYPHMGGKASRFVLTNNAAERFFYPENSFNDLRSKAWRNVPPASTRALKVLDLVGVDWREDADEGGRAILDPHRDRDNGERPKLPHGWPRPDAGLVTALSDMQRLDAAIGAIPETDGRDMDEMPEYGPLSEARDEAISALIYTRAEGFDGLLAKARALLAKSLSDDAGAEIGQSLARDLVGATQSIIEPKPDPIIAEIDQCRRLVAKYKAIHSVCGSHPAGHPSWAGHDEAHAAMWHRWEHSLLKTVPTTGAGCAALARYVAEWCAVQGPVRDHDAPVIFALIAKSPAL